MFFYFRVLLHSLFFLVILELAARADQWVFYWGCLVILITLWGVRKITRRLLFSVIPVVLSIASILMLYLIDSPGQKNVFVVLATLIYYLALLGIFRLKGYQQDQTARGIVSASVMAALFFAYASAYGLYLNFNVPLWSLMLVFIVATFSVSFEYFTILNPDRKEVARYSLILALLMGEITWVANFWPFGYLTTGAALLAIFYLFWDLTQSHFLRSLSQKRMIANLALLGILLSLLLLSSRWMPVV